MAACCARRASALAQSDKSFSLSFCAALQDRLPLSLRRIRAIGSVIQCTQAQVPGLVCDSREAASCHQKRVEYASIHQKQPIVLEVFGRELRIRTRYGERRMMSRDGSPPSTLRHGISADVDVKPRRQPCRGDSVEGPLRPGSNFNITP